jgi:hypothetical protein
MQRIFNTLFCSRTTVGLIGSIELRWTQPQPRALERILSSD